jgi:hypothetical protein
MVDTTSEVIKTLNDALNSVETETSDLAGGVRAIVSDKEAGQLFGTLRRELDDDQWEAKRGPNTVGDDGSIVVHISAEEERGLGELFG